MEFILALIGALSLSSIPLLLGWRRTAGEADMVRRMGLTPPKKRLDPEKYARQTGTGLTFNQIAIGYVAWSVGAFVAGLKLGFFSAILFGVAGALFYVGSLQDKRHEFSVQQAKDVLRGLGIVEMLLSQGRPLLDAWTLASMSVGPAGEIVLSDLVVRLRACTPGEEGGAIHEWSMAWDNPAVEIVATVLFSYYNQSSGGQLVPLIANLRSTLTNVVEILTRARAASKGIEGQSKFLAGFPPGIMVLIGLTTPSAGAAYARNPLFLLPVLLGSILSFYLSMRMVRDGLSIEASMGVEKDGTITVDRMGTI